MIKFLDFLNPMISRTPDGEEYLRRYFIFESERFRIYLHKISLSDADPCMHDHPWWFVTFILRGGYIEHTPKGTFERKPGQVRYNPIPWLHRLELKKPAWTLLIGGRVKRTWGFMTPNGWMPFDEYNKQRELEEAAAAAAAGASAAIQSAAS